MAADTTEQRIVDWLEREKVRREVKKSKRRVERKQPEGKKG